MKRILKISVPVFTMLVFFAAHSEEQRNYIRTQVMLDSAGTECLSSVRYYDGLGRHEQTVSVGASPSGADIVFHNSRDRAGRIIREYNDVPSYGNGKFISENHVLTLATEAYGDAMPFRVTEYEQSPMGRTVSVTGQGQAWHNANKRVRKSYFGNDPSEKGLNCLMLAVTDTRSIKDTAVSVTVKGAYPKGSLHVVRTEDEDGNTSFAFTDKDGRTVLHRSAAGGDYADTYYAYDIAGNLTAVIPPALSKSFSKGSMSSASEKARLYAYFYIYDWFGRCRAKKLPGRRWSVASLDRAGKAVMTQDGNLRESGECLFTLTDAFGRGCVSGIAKKAISLSESINDVVLAERCTATDSLGGYAVKGGCISLPSDNLLKVNYYDDYSFLDGKQFGRELSYRNVSGFDVRYVCASDASISAKGMLTGSATRILGDSLMLYKAVYYDYRGNVIQTHEQNAMGGYDSYYYHLSFTGKPLAVRHEHRTADCNEVTDFRYTYDRAERLLTVSAARGGSQTVELVSNTYDDLGRLSSRSLGNSAQGLVEYGYNVRGWATGITNEHFSQTLHYEDGHGGSKPCFNGNICAMEWNQKEAVTASSPVRQNFSFGYDPLDRLVSAEYACASGQTPSASDALSLQNGRDYSCRYGYDLNGNMTSLHRRGVSSAISADGKAIWSFGDIDNLNISYSGNQLKKVTDQVEALTYAGAMDFKDGVDKDAEYEYDANGNLTRDRNKGIYSIAYNVLNLPQTVLFNDGHLTRYTYDANGRKLKTEYILSNFRFAEFEPIGPLEPVFKPMASPLPGGSGGQITIDKDRFPVDSAIYMGPKTLMTVEYCGNYIYRNGKLERILNDYGYYANGAYHFNITDYQGNIRAVIREDGILEETSSYYPYGGLMGCGSMGVQPYKYGGKELDRENGLDLYDSHARMYDPIIGRTTTIDPLAEKYTHLSPYLWCAANPLKYVDRNGMYFNNADEKQANIYTDELVKRKDVLIKSNTEESKGQLLEIDKSMQDIEDMRNDSERRYSFEDANDAPLTKQLSDGTIVMSIDKNMNGNYAHEIRHGGQVARGEFGYIKGSPDKRYGASHEIDAYRAQLSAYGEFSYMPYYDFDKDPRAAIIMTFVGQQKYWKKITRLEQITLDFIRSISEGPGTNIQKLYKEIDLGKEWFER